MPDEVKPVLLAGEKAVRMQFGLDLTREQCLVIALERFADTWSDADRQTRAARRRVLERDGYRCVVPGCTCRRHHEHHIEFRSHGGGNEDPNRCLVCPGHHLRQVHEGRLRIAGRAPDDLLFEMGIVDGEPYAVFRGEFLEVAGARGTVDASPDAAEEAA